MGIQEREYMRTPDDPGLPNFTGGITGIAGLLFVIILVHSRSRPAFDISEIEQQLEEQMIQVDQQREEQVIQVDSTYHRYEQLSRIAPLDINSATYDELRLLPRVTDAIADGIISARPIDSIEALDDVYGIGPKTIELIRPHIAIKSNDRIDNAETNAGTNAETNGG